MSFYVRYPSMQRTSPASSKLMRCDFLHVRNHVGRLVNFGKKEFFS